MHPKPLVVICAHIGMFMLGVIMVANALDFARKSCCIQPMKTEQMACEEDMQAAASAAANCCDGGHCEKCPAPATITALGNTNPAIVVEKQDAWPACDQLRSAVPPAPERPPIGISSL